jgi:hypothetical protein
MEGVVLETSMSAVWTANFPEGVSFTRGWPSADQDCAMIHVFHAMMEARGVHNGG